MLFTGFLIYNNSMVIHNISTWFGDTKTFPLFYQNNFKQNFTGTIKLPPKVARIFFGPTVPTGQAYDTGIARLQNSMGEMAISMLLNAPQAGTLKKIPFAWLEKDTQETLRNAVCEIVQNACVNSQVFERLLANGMTSPTFTVNEDLTNWFITNDSIGILAKQLINNSGISQYEWVSEGYLTTIMKDGNIKILGSIDEKLIKDLEV